MEMILLEKLVVLLLQEEAKAAGSATLQIPPPVGLSLLMSLPTPVPPSFILP